MPEEIYHLNEHGHLEPMTEERFALENKLQELVAKYPKLLSGEQMNPNNPRRWLLISREQGIADIVGAGDRWSVDHLLMDQDARPTLVEAKLSGNPEIRRTVVGQMMDYAAHATQTWTVADIRQAFEGRCKSEGKNPSEELTAFLQPDGEPDADKFWEDVETNLRAGRLRLLFVADSIPDELARVVEFLNEQMPRTEVLAVEIKQFLGETGRTLVPRVIGRTASAPDRTMTLRIKKTVEQVLNDMPSVQARDAARRLADVAQARGARISRGDAGFQIRWRHPDWPKQYFTLAWIYPIFDYPLWMKTKGFTFGMNDWGFEEKPVALRDTLLVWADQFEYDSFTVPASSSDIIAWAVSPDDAAANIDLVVERLERVLDHLNDLASSGGPAC